MDSVCLVNTTKDCGTNMDNDLQNYTPEIIIKVNPIKKLKKELPKGYNGWTYKNF